MANKFNAVALQNRIQTAGLWGPALIIAFMILAIVFTPIPSAPVAMSAGAVYGHTLGTVYVVAGLFLYHRYIQERKQDHCVSDDAPFSL